MGEQDVRPAFGRRAVNESEAARGGCSPPPGAGGKLLSKERSGLRAGPTVSSECVHLAGSWIKRDTASRKRGGWSKAVLKATCCQEMTVERGGGNFLPESQLQSPPPCVALATVREGEFIGTFPCEYLGSVEVPAGSCPHLLLSYIIAGALGGALRSLNVGTGTGNAGTAFPVFPFGP